MKGCDFEHMKQYEALHNVLETDVIKKYNDSSVPFRWTHWTKFVEKEWILSCSNCFNCSQCYWLVLVLACERWYTGSVDGYVHERCYNFSPSYDRKIKEDSRVEADYKIYRKAEYLSLEDNINPQINPLKFCWFSLNFQIFCCVNCVPSNLSSTRPPCRAHSQKRRCVTSELLSHRRPSWICIGPAQSRCYWARTVASSLWWPCERQIQIKDYSPSRTAGTDPDTHPARLAAPSDCRHFSPSCCSVVCQSSPCPWLANSTRNFSPCGLSSPGECSYKKVSRIGYFQPQGW